MNPGKRVYALLESVGAVLKRRTRHEVWQLPNGKSFVRACTPSDVRSDFNNLSDLKHALGVVGEKKTDAPPKDRKAKPGVSRAVRYPANNILGEKLAAAPVAYQALADRCAAMEARIVDLENYRLEVENSSMVRFVRRVGRLRNLFLAHPPTNTD